MKNIVYFDLETQKSAAEVGGWGNKHKMLMSIGVTYSTLSGQYQIFQEHEVDQLITQMTRADLVVGFNHVGFDYSVLNAYTPFDFKQLPSFDILVAVEKILGIKIKLDSIASATLGYSKTAEGMQALIWWKEGKIYEIAEYCAYDVKITKEVFEFGAIHGVLYYSDKTGRRCHFKVDWRKEAGGIPAPGPATIPDRIPSLS